MSSFTIATWNVLHRVHAENWVEPAIEAHPDEHARVEAIAARVERLLLGDHMIDAIGLQEVSGDQLAALRLRIADRATILAQRHRRTPRWRRASTTAIADRAEYLVIMSREPCSLVRGETFVDDDGKGLLAAAFPGSGAMVIDTHVTYGEPAAAQLAVLAAVAGGHDGPCVIVGDFNADRVRVLDGLGPGFATIDAPAGSLPTRPRAGTASKAQTIDHVIVRRAHGDHARVISADGLSDHNLVLAQIVVPSP
jgi:endonuclease/exonuclease/phosphatase family metal-dependent hydrolase